MYYFFYFPLGTETRLKRIPAATLGLVIALALVHYLLNYFGPTYAWWDRLVLSADAPTLSQAITACFVHANLVHLGGNLLYLVTFGPALEDRVGRAAFLAVFLLCGLVSMLVEAEISRLLHPGQVGVVVLGASGAISGLMGLFAARCWFLRVRVAHATFAYLRGTARGGVTALPAWVALAAWSGLQAIYAAIALGDPRGATAYWAHFSGLALGFGIGAVSGLLRRGLWERRLLRAERYMSEANWFAALGEYEAYREGGAGERAEGLLGEARTLRLVRRNRDALAAYHRAFTALVARGAWGEAADVAEERRLRHCAARRARVRPPRSNPPRRLQQLWAGLRWPV